MATLERLTTEDMLEAFGLGGARLIRPALERLCRPAARHLALHVAAYDDRVGRHGLRPAADWAVRRFLGGLEVAGQGNLPTGGPLLVLANHPGLSDALALFAALHRDDLRALALDWPFFLALPHTSRHLIYCSWRSLDRLAALRAGVGHLRRGGALLVFPRGEIEPDPAVLPGALRSLEGWSRSIGHVARHVGALAVVPAVVSGVLSPAAQRNPLTRLRRRQRDRERLGAMLQVLFAPYRRVTVRVAFGAPLYAHELGSLQNPQAITTTLVKRARHLIERPPREWQRLI